MFAMDSQTPTDEQLYTKIYHSYINVNSSESTVENYTKLAEDYEKDFVGLGYETPLVVVQTALKYLAGEKTSLAILDVACGTGLVAEGLRKEGFEGDIDGIDGSSGMINIAKAKDKLYRDLRVAFIVPNEPMPYSDNMYDGIVVSGGFGPGHLMPESLGELVRITKRGGVIVFATRYNKQAGEYLKKLDFASEEMVKSGVWKKENVFQTNYFRFDLSAENPNDNALKALVYCFRKC